MEREKSKKNSNSKNNKKKIIFLFKVCLKNINLILKNINKGSNEMDKNEKLISWQLKEIKKFILENITYNIMLEFKT